MAGISEFVALNDSNDYHSIGRPDLNLKVAVDRKFKIPKEYLNEFIKEKDATEPKNKKFSDNQIGLISITDADLKQYDEWINDKSKKPKLLNEFDSAEEYNNYLQMYKDTHLTLDKDPAVLKFSKTFSISGDEKYQFLTDTDAWQGDENGLDFGHVIGSLIFSVTYCHLFHLCTTDYPAHMALDEYYKDMPELVDALAEKCLSNNAYAVFVNAIVPGVNPVDYLERLKKYVITFENQINIDEESSYKSELDEIVNLISSTLYKLKRLATYKGN